MEVYGIFGRDRIELFETMGPELAFVHRIERVHYHKRSKYQDILVGENRLHGKMLILDNVFNVSNLMEAYYHEPMAHIPVGLVNRENIEALIIGGGDFGVAYHLLKHKNIKKIAMCELDGNVVKVCREHFPWGKICEKDPRFKLEIGDGFKYLDNLKENSLDIIIIDSTDPFDKAGILISEEFYTKLKRVIKEDGVIIQLISDFHIYGECYSYVLPRVKKHFIGVKVIAVPVAFYITGYTGMLLFSKNEKMLESSRIPEKFVSNIPDVKTLTDSNIRAFLELPPVLKKFIEKFSTK
ncbi:spermidine synthase [Thermotomaculum hydrothermale]|uniref:Polyamine aminopropyltransferase n=1 Tax=Thermotomaculum hydrothermale TaxID=981385 RepID=A0A7R6T0C1_9BACT|nr:hypothetical protein [Thermotomaculum hydrothermale]BBB33557.1 spermidine synthase [Thermotomaculum hydrothermale]